MKRKWLLAILFIVLLFNLSACGEGDDSGSGNNSNPTADISENQGDIVIEQPAIDEDDYSDDSIVATNTFSFTNSAISGTGATINKTTLTITKAGTYSVSGTCSDGQIIINAKGETVYLILDNLTLTCATSAPIFVEKGEKVIIVAKENTTNTLIDTANYILNSDSEPTATIFSKADLTINGTGKIIIDANYNNAIQCKDTLKILDVTIEANSTDDGIVGKDFLILENANIDLTTTGDGLRTTNEETGYGTLTINGGTYKLVCGNDAIQSCTDLLINKGTFNITTGGGSSSYLSIYDTESYKGIKVTNNLVIAAGTITVSAKDDAIHSNNSIEINGGVLTLASGDDGIHADTSMSINGGELTISKSYEGLESANITINSGTISVTASDDGININGGNDQSAMGGRPGQGGFSELVTTGYLKINGGTLNVNAVGDGLDSNGNILMTNGLVIVDGPSSSGNGALDYAGTFVISGGTLLAVGSSGMAQAPSTTSSQYSLSIRLSSTQAMKAINITDASDNSLLTFTPTKQYSSIIFSSPSLSKNSQYKIYLAGSLYTTITVSSIVTSSGSSGGRW